MKISAIIPSYKNPEYLDLCLKSAFAGKKLSDTEIIVILDGYASESMDVLNKYPGVLLIENETNHGETYCHNVGVTMASGDWILIVNNDNVFPEAWDERLTKLVKEREIGFDIISDTIVWAPNQIEPRSSIFKSFIMADFGITPEEFQFDKFIEFELGLNTVIHFASEDGSTWPIFMNKKYYMALRGIDGDFPHTPVADWDFFYRCQLIGMKTFRTHDIHFYHFAGAANPNKSNERGIKEAECMEYFKWKWGFYPRRDELNRII